MYNINPILWGPHLWKYLHYLTLAYPDNPKIETQLLYKEYFLNLYNFIPCEKCRINYQRHLLELPLTDDILQSRNKLIRWVFDLHNIVNKETGKKILPFSDFIKMYTADPKDIENNKFKRNIIIAGIIILIILMIINKYL
jgi:hypothetical protein